MDTAVKQRLIGAAVLAALAMIFLPMLLQGPDVHDPDAAQVPLDAPAASGQKFETRELPLAEPAPSAPAGGVLGLGSPGAGEADPNAVVTIDEGASPPPPTMAEPSTAEPSTAAPTDAATGEPLDAAPVATPAPATTPTSAPVAPAPASGPPLPMASAGGRYAVNVGSFAHLGNARALADRLRARQLPVISENVTLAGQPALRLRVGPYAERAAAEAARLRVEQVAGAGAAVIALDAAPERPAAAATTRPAAAAAAGFAVQLGALRSEADAITLRDRARGAGFVAFHQRMETANGVLYRVRVGPEADRGGADKLREAVAGKLGITGIVVAHP